ELRRANYGADGERLGFDLYPYTEDQVAAVKRAVLQARLLDAARGRTDALRVTLSLHLRGGGAHRRARSAGGAVAQGRGTRVRARVRGARRVSELVGLDVGTSGVKAIAIDESGEAVARAEEPYPLSMPQPGGAGQDP